MESKGVKVVYDETIENFIANSVIDYSTNMFYRGFYVRGAGMSTC
ncbi:hypothetical protein [Dethiobacter alkaliphilus]|nr:hypothetical protein [Dethiobacter alkaliphilus]MCW3488531.1 hypothetical protein [Dethiobacter alkaliphilus]